MRILINIFISVFIASLMGCADIAVALTGVRDYVYIYNKCPKTIKVVFVQAKNQSIEEIKRDDFSVKTLVKTFYLLVDGSAVFYSPPYSSRGENSSVFSPSSVTFIISDNEFRRDNPRGSWQEGVRYQQKFQKNYSPIFNAFIVDDDFKLYLVPTKYVLRNVTDCSSVIKHITNEDWEDIRIHQPLGFPLNPSKGNPSTVQP